jgi:hypothetical protein
MLDNEKERWQKLQTAEMRFLRSVKGCIRLDEIKNECIRKELGVFSVNDRVKTYRQDWIDKVTKFLNCKRRSYK